MKVFITGIAGFLGSHLADRMIELGHEVSGNDNLIGGYHDNVPAKAKFYESDCCDLKTMMDITAGSDIVFHTAATAYEGLSFFSPDFITKNNFQASVSTFTAAVQNKVKRVVFCSSMARYGKQPHPFTEETPPKPEDPYGVSKVGAEEILKLLCEMNKIEWVIAIPHNIIGPRQKYDDPYRNVLSIMINRCLQNKPPVIYGDGNQTRCFSYVDDCIYCLEKMAFDPNIKNDIFNIGPDEEFTTINELADIVMKKTEFKGTPVFYDTRPGEVKHAVCSSDKARKLLGYETKTSLEKAIEKTLEYIKDRGVKPFSYSYNLEIINDLTPKTWKEELI